MAYILDTATAVRRDHEGVLTARIAKEYWNFDSAFGGWGLALALEAVTSQHADLPALAGATAHFYRPLRADSFAIAVEAVRTGRRASFFRVVVTSQGLREETVLAVDFIFSDSRQSELDYTRPYPQVQGLAESPALPAGPGPKWLALYDQRLGKGQPFSAQDHPNSALWLTDKTARPWDQKSLLAASDTPMPRTFFVDPKPRFSSTVTYIFQMFATPDELTALGTEAVLVEAQGEAVMRGRSAQSVYLWGPDKRLLAVSNQLAFY